MAIDYKSELAKIINSMQSDGMDLDEIDMRIIETVGELIDDIYKNEFKH